MNEHEFVETWPSDKAIYQRRLRAWRKELADNKHNMADIAPRAINVLECEIERRWPGTIIVPPNA